MHALAAAGYHAVTMNQMWDNWHDGTPLPPGKPIVISFDNGYESQYRFALPVLRAMGWVGVENLQLSGLPPLAGRPLRAAGARAVAAGWELDTQGCNHADLITLDARASCTSRSPSRASASAPSTTSTPTGSATPRASTTPPWSPPSRRPASAARPRWSPGWASPTEDPYRLPRLRVLAGTSPRSLLGEIAGIRGNAPPGSSYTPVKLALALAAALLAALAALLRMAAPHRRLDPASLPAALALGTPAARRVDVGADPVGLSVEYPLLARELGSGSCPPPALARRSGDSARRRSGSAATPRTRRRRPERADSGRERPATRTSGRALPASSARPPSGGSSASTSPRASRPGARRSQPTRARRSRRRG